MEKENNAYDPLTNIDYIHCQNPSHQSLMDDIAEKLKHLPNGTCSKMHSLPKLMLRNIESVDDIVEWYRQLRIVQLQATIDRMDEVPSANMEGYFDDIAEFIATGKL